MRQLSMCLLLVCSFFFSCKKEDVRKQDDSYNPQILAANFTHSTDLTHPHVGFKAGKTYVYGAETADGTEKVEIKRLAQTKMVMGITCVVVNDKAYLDDVLIEDTDDWFAQDDDGNVWYMGEDVDNYNDDGTFKDKAGSWEAGVDGAKPGFFLPANPQKGMAYRQEYYFGEAEDEGEVLETGLTVTVPFGTFENCIKTKDFTELEPDVLENKFYAPGIGVIKSVNVKEGEAEELVDIIE